MGLPGGEEISICMSAKTTHGGLQLTALKPKMKALVINCEHGAVGRKRADQQGISSQLHAVSIGRQSAQQDEDAIPLCS